MSLVPFSDSPLDICDGAMIILATSMMNVLHPGALMGHDSQWTWNDHRVAFARDPEKIAESSNGKDNASK